MRRINRMAKCVFFLIVGLTCSLQAEQSDSDIEITRFDLNPVYGFAQRTGDTSETMANYLLLTFANASAEDSLYTIIDSILATDRPQLCDSNAVSYILRYEKDSAMLIVADYHRTTAHDTVTTFPIEDLGGRYSSGQRRLYNVSKYMLFRPASLLFWQIPYPRRSIIEAGRILENGTYETLDVCVECGFPQMILDFSLVLYTKYISYNRFGLGATHTLINAFDCIHDSSYLIRRVVGNCYSPQMLHRDEDLFCIWSQDMDVSSFSAVKDSIPVPLFSIEYPVSFAGYRIFEDSIVLRTTNCCDKDYGIQTHVIPR